MTGSQKNPGYQGWSEFPWLAIPHACCHTPLPAELRAVGMTQSGQLETCVWSLETLTHVPLFFADVNLDLFLLG